MMSLHREEIMSRLRMKYGSAAAFERAKSLRSRSVRDVLQGKKVTKTARAIAKELGISITDVSIIYQGESPIGDNSDTQPPAHRLNRKGK